MSKRIRIATAVIAVALAVPENAVSRGIDQARWP